MELSVMVVPFMELSFRVLAVSLASGRRPGPGRPSGEGTRRCTASILVGFFGFAWRGGAPGTYLSQISGPVTSISTHAPPARHLLRGALSPGHCRGAEGSGACVLQGSRSPSGSKSYLPIQLRSVSSS